MVTYVLRRMHCVWLTFLCVQYRFTEFSVPCASIARGLASVVPSALFNLLNWRELEIQVVGRGFSVTNLPTLERITKYSGFQRSDPVVANFWKMMKEHLTDEQRSDLLTFVW